MPRGSTRPSGRQRRRGRGHDAPGPVPESTPRTRFVVDAMLGSLARKLRALGFDAAYYRSGGDSGLMELSRREGRIILTADRSLAARSKARGLTAFLATGNTDGRRIGGIARQAAAGGVTLVRGAPLCSLCDGELRRVKKDQVPEVPPSVLRRHLLFFECESCGQVYWRGSHWKKLMSLARRLDQRNHATVS